MDHSGDSMIIAMQSILRIANDLKEATASYDEASATIDTLPIPISLPSPHPLLPSLLNVGVGHEIATAASKIYQLRAEEFKQYIEQRVTTTCLPLPGASPAPLMNKVISAFTEMYQRRLALWREEIIQRVKQVPKTSSAIVQKNSRCFNHEYIPLLEHFFEGNPFPTHADKMLLAKKSNMEYRQIHVWFQNRRSRTKKEGKTLTKKSAYERAMKPLDQPHQRMRGYTGDSDSQASRHSRPRDKTQTGPAPNNISKSAFASSSPPHAFPSPYPPTCHYDPFPHRNGLCRFTMPQWRRVGCPNSPPSVSISIDRLVEIFSRLNVRDEVHPKGSRKSQSQAATAAITIIPSRAPHPSLIVSENPQTTNIVRLYPSVRAPISYSKIFQDCGRTLSPVTLIPPNGNQHGKRKTVSLPYRYSGRRNTSRAATPSEVSSISCSSPHLFATDSEGCNCFSSVSPLSTPPDIGTPEELPH